MSKVIEAEYLAEAHVLKLEHPLDGVRDRERVRLVIEQSDWPRVDEEAGRALARAVREAFGRDNIAV